MHMERSRKKVLFLLQHAPYGSSHARELIDTIYATAAFDQNVQLLFTGEGIWQLLPDQQGNAIASKDVGKLLGALSYYDIHALFVDEFSLNTRKLDISELTLPVVSLDNAAMRQLLREADCVITL